MAAPSCRVFHLATSASALVLLTAALSADSRLDFKVTEGRAPVVETMFIGYGKVRVDRGKVSSVIIDPKAKTMTALDHEKKEFSRFGDADIDELAKAWKENMDAMKDLLASMPPDERAGMEAALAGLMNLADGAKIVELGADSVAGKPCRIYRMTAKDVIINESCISDVATLNLSTADGNTLREAMLVGQDVTQKISQFISPQVAELMSPFKSGQIALRSTDITRGERNTSEFVRVTTDALSPELFAVPSTYKESKMEGGPHR